MASFAPPTRGKIPPPGVVPGRGGGLPPEAMAARQRYAAGGGRMPPPNVVKGMPPGRGFNPYGNKQQPGMTSKRALTPELMSAMARRRLGG